MWLCTPLFTLAMIPCTISAQIISSRSSEKKYLSIPIGVRQGGQKFQRDVTKDGLIRRSSATKAFATPSFFFIDIDVGTPPQTIKVDLDTGSTDMGIQLDTCIQLSPERICDPSDFYLTNKGVGNCTGGSYSPALSYTHQFVVDGDPEIKCGFPNPERICYGLSCYGDGSGFISKLMSDNVSIASFNARVMFAGVVEEYQNFLEYGRADGVLGLAYREISSFNAPSVLEPLLQANNLPDVFGMDLCSNGGSFIMGKEPPSSYQRTPITHSKYYSVDLQQMQFSDKFHDSIISINSRISGKDNNDFGTIVDSGTTLIILKRSVYGKWLETFVATYCRIYDEDNGCCTLYDPEATIGFTFADGNGSSFTITRTVADISTRCDGLIGFTCSPNIVSSDFENGNILGAAFMQGMSVYFDREHKEIAMAPLSCQTPSGVPVWYLITFSMVAFFSCILFVIAVSIGIYEWRAGRCCCCSRTVPLASQASTGPASSEFATVQATLTPGIEGSYGATGKIEQAKPIFDDDDDGDGDGETA